jgi:Na+/H+ antiporter NhaD/arsenite permease-like protein
VNRLVNALAQVTNDLRPRGGRARLVAAISSLVVLSCLAGAASYTPGSAELDEPIGNRLSLLTVVPFAGLLVSIAVLPLVASHWWERNLNKAKVSAFFAVPLACVLIFHFGHGGYEALAENVRDYVSFMLLLGSLFVISGGILVRGTLPGTPLMNTTTLAIGALLANVFGTTGASMVLIRPLIRANRGRRNIAHIVIFFIFVVSNCGGLLTPLGDPPLFLGYLNGVPFAWTLRLLPQWLVVNAALLAISYVWDRMLFAGGRPDRVEKPLEAAAERSPLRIVGLHNLLFLLGIIAIVLAAGQGFGNGGGAWPFGIGESLMVVLTAGSFFLTERGIHEQNEFRFGPIVEVAVLFAGIFITMTPALLLLDVHGGELALHTPGHYFWASGFLSSVLDNAPTYLAFTAAACGSHGIPLDPPYLDRLLDPEVAPG